MRKILSFIFTICLTLTLGVTAYAIGDGNIDGGGGGMGDGNSQSYWNSGQEGVRLTVVRASDHAVVTVPIDLTNRPPSSNVYHFGKVSKISYNNGFSLNPIQGGYSCIKPPQAIPTVVSASGNSNIDAIKRYFCSEYLIELVANHTGMNYDTLINGDYKLLLEPLAYYKILGVDIVTTATEAALYDQVIDGKLRYWMGSLTHKNLPLAMFLEVSDLGYPAWNGSTTTSASNANIISSLGLGIVRFEEEPETPQVTDYDYEYRVNTEVITSVYVDGGQSDPDDDTTVYFTIDGRNYTVRNIYYPDGDSQLVWVKWTTPSEPQKMTICVRTSGQGDAEQSTITCNIVDLDENPPPNPVADDRNDSFRQERVPNRAEETSTSWSVWDPWWRANWEWESDWVRVSRGCYSSCDDDCSGGHKKWEDQGEWVDNGWWVFDCDRYSATLRGDMKLLNDRYNPTATSSTFKSGYGVNIEVESRVSTNQSSAVSKTPNAVSYFPEFNYDTYWRLLDRMRTGSSSEFEFQRNVYSTYNNRTHFSPIWMPDGPYEVNTWLLDYWTPTGMLSLNLTDSLTVRGNLWQDWHVAPKDTN